MDRTNPRKSISKRPTAASANNAGLLKAILLVICVCLVAVAVSFACFSWDRWHAHNDTNDIVGQWIYKDFNTISISEDQMQLAKDLTYSYVLDQHNKTINFNVGDLQGSAVYEFSNDRNTLYIVEGASPDLLADFLNYVGISKHDFSKYGDALITLTRQDKSQFSQMDVQDF